MREFDVIIAGGGAAGVMAAGIAARKGYRVLLCEKMEKLQRKVRITGKGRCNLTNMRSEREFLDKVRSSSDFFAPAFRHFSNRDAVRFFEKLGVPLSVERGERVFPSSGRAWDIADAHVRWCKNAGVEIACHTSIRDIFTESGRITGALVETQEGKTEKIAARRIVIATGGASYPATGSTGEGYLLAHRLGHRIVEIRPSLTPLETGGPFTGKLSGLKLRNVSATLQLDGTPTAEEFGELEFTPFGISGPIVLRLSRRAVDALIDEEQVRISLDLKPALDPERLMGRIDREITLLGGSTMLRRLIGRLVPSRLIPAVLGTSGLRPDLPLSALDLSGKKAVIDTLKHFSFPITDYRPFPEAIVTAGGVCTDEVDPTTMQSRIVKGLYFAGEILDIDADTGGYNLQIAYSTGRLAGELNE